MNSTQIRIRQKLLILLILAGCAGIGAFVAVIAIAEHQVFNRFIPENRALRDVQARSAQLIQDYYRYMLTPELIDAGVLKEKLLLIRQSLDRYRGLIDEQPLKRKLAGDIEKAIDILESSGAEMIESRRNYEVVYLRQSTIEEDIEEIFKRYRNEVNADIGEAIENNEWRGLVRDYLPELRMIEGVQHLMTRLFVKIREYQTDPNEQVIAQIDTLVTRIGSANSMFELYVENSNARSSLAGQVLDVFERMLSVVDDFTRARKKAEFAVSRAEQAGIDMNEALVSAIDVSEAAGWRELRELSLLAGVILVGALILSYLLIYIGLQRILMPLEQLQTVIARLGEGDFKQRSRVERRGDEIGQLAGAFNRMADQLEEHVRQKQQFIEQVEDKNVELERFTYTASHELKSPLVTVKGFLVLLERDLAEGDQARVAKDREKISSAVDIMNQQLEDLLELSRLGRGAYHASGFALDELCQDVVHMMLALVKEKDAEVRIDEDMPWVYADPARIREVIRNLVENGIKFAPASTRPLVEIDAEKSGDRVLCRVRDNGRGIEPRYHDKVFGLFDLLDSGVRGTGIGLALVKRIVDIHQGDIWIESQGDGQGCCFCFRLPGCRGS